MKTLISLLLAAAALAVPSAALAHHGHDGRRGLLAVGTGTATSGTFKSRLLGNGTYTATVAATGAATTTRFGSCAPATGTVTLTTTGTAAAATLAGSVSGRLCTAASTTAKLKSAFFGKLTVTAATGAAAPAAGGKGFVGLLTKADGTTRFFLAARKAGARLHH